MPGARCADLGERALAWIEDRLTQDFPVEIVERFAEVVDAIETEMSELERGLAGRRGRPSRSARRIDDDDVGNKLALAFVGLCPPGFPVGPSVCLVASLKYDLPRIILVGTGRRRQNQVRQELSLRRSQ